MQELSKSFFDIEIKDEELDDSKIEKGYDDTGLILDGGCLPFYPVLNKIMYNKETQIYSLYTIDYALVDTSDSK